MIDWETINPPLLRLLGRLAVATDFEVEHAQRPRKLVSAHYRRSITIEPLSIRGGDQDEERRELIPDDATGSDAKWAGKVRITTVGDRQVTLQIVCDALDNTDAGWAWATVETLRTRLRRQSTLAELDELDCALLHVGDAVTVQFTFEGRCVSRVLFELQLNIHAEDTESDPTGRIEHVVWTDKVKDVSGTQLPSPPLTTNETTPPLTP